VLQHLVYRRFCPPKPSDLVSHVIDYAAFDVPALPSGVSEENNYPSKLALILRLLGHFYHKIFIRTGTFRLIVYEKLNPQQSWDGAEVEAFDDGSNVGSTPVVYDDFLGCFLKLECRNPSGSHKDRETVYLIRKHGWEKRYVVVSSGNAGISLAYWTRGRAVVLLPEVTPKEKIEAIKRLGAEVLVRGKYFYDSYNLVAQIAKKRNLVNVSPGFAERWRGDVSISYELRELQPNYVFVPAADLTLAYGIAYGFNEMLEKGLIAEAPTVVSCVLPNHPLVHLTEDVAEHHRDAFNSIYTHGEEGENMEREFLNFPFARIESTTDLDSVLKLEKKYPEYDPAALLAMYISMTHSGKKVVIVTGVRR